MVQLLNSFLASHLKRSGASPMLQIRPVFPLNNDLRYLFRKFGSWWWTCAAILFFAGCAGFHYEQISVSNFASTQDVDWLTHEPNGPYVVLAKFRGTELSWCVSSEPNCSLVKEARQRGAEAIWVQRTSQWTRPEQWVDIQGRMTRIPAQTYERIEGVLIRYKQESPR